MDPKVVQNILDPAALGAAAGVLLFVMVLGSLLAAKWERRHAVSMPVGVAAAFACAFVILFSFPQNGSIETWKMIFWAAAAIGGMLTIAGCLRGARQVVVTALAILLLPMVVVHGPWMVHGGATPPAWEHWEVIAGSLGLIAALYALGFGKTTEPRLWLVGPVVTWVSASTASVVLILHGDLTMGKMQVVLAVLSGVVAVAGIFGRLRATAARAGLSIAMIFAAVLAVGVHYDDSVPVPVWVLLACGPLAAATAWVPAVRKKAWFAVGVAFFVAIALLVPALVMAFQSAPPLE